VGDHANDRVRVDGKDVRARVIAEGGNLGCTQRGRLEYWAAGGLINTDAVDNSGGVDMSDHEVNIKILLDMLVKKGVIAGKDERNHILSEMTENVAALVLADNRNQARAITLDQLRSAAAYERYVALVEDMVDRRIVSRTDEGIPTRDGLLGSPQRDRGLPRPLLAMLLGHTKMWAFALAMQTDLSDAPAAARFLDGYFPDILRERFAGHFKEHALRREIIATGAVNYVINNAGILILPQLMAATKASIGQVIAAYLEVDRESGAPERRAGILHAGLGAKPAHEVLLQIESILEGAVRDRLSGKPAAQVQSLLAGVK
jgi:glutamate dehydrogenase